MKYKKLMKYSEIMEWLGNNKITNIQYIYCAYDRLARFKSVEGFKNFLENKFDKNWLKANKYWVPCINDNKSIVIVVD
jgi:hypothetical protein